MGYHEKLSEADSKVDDPDMSRSYTVGEYLEWTFDGLYELIRGRVHKISPAPSEQHQEVCLISQGYFTIM